MKETLATAWKLLCTIFIHGLRSAVLENKRVSFLIRINARILHEIISMSCTDWLCLIDLQNNEVTSAPVILTFVCNIFRYTPRHIYTVLGRYRKLVVDQYGFPRISSHRREIPKLVINPQ